jgi:hypothetical protein
MLSLKTASSYVVFNIKILLPMQHYEWKSISNVYLVSVHKLRIKLSVILRLDRGIQCFQ